MQKIPHIKWKQRNFGFQLWQSLIELHGLFTAADTLALHLKRNQRAQSGDDLYQADLNQTADDNINVIVRLRGFLIQQLLVVTHDPAAKRGPRQRLQGIAIPQSVLTVASAPCGSRRLQFYFAVKPRWQDLDQDI